MSVKHNLQGETRGRLSIRPAVESDALAIAAIHVAAWRAAYANLVPAEYLQALDVTERSRHWGKTLREMSDNRVVLLAETDAPVGFASYGPSRDLDRVGDAELYSIYVSPAAFGLGAGTMLVARGASEMAARGFITINLWVFERNVQARRFYERLGWKEEATTKQTKVAGAWLSERRHSRHVLIDTPARRPA